MQTSMRKKALVIGGAGFIGSHLVKHLLAQGHCVHVYDNLFAGDLARLPQSENLSVQVADILDGDALDTAFENFRPQLVFHLAALLYIPYCIAHPRDTLRVNVEGTQAVLQMCARHPLEKLVFYSSAAVYPNCGGALHEEIAPAPVEIYGLSKFFGEQLVHQFVRDTGQTCLIFRLFNVYGDGESKPHVIRQISKQLAQGDTIAVGDVTPLRDYIFVDDVVSASVQLGLMPSSGVNTFNLGTGRGTSVRQLVELMGEVLQRRITMEQKAELMRTIDRMELTADMSQMRDVGGWQAQYDVLNGLRVMFEREGMIAPQAELQPT